MALDVVATLKKPEIKNAIVPLFQKHVSPDRFFAMAHSSAKAFMKKSNVAPESVLLAIYQSAKLGLEPDDALGHAHLVPFYSNKTKKTYATLIPGYRGLIYLARRSGKVKDLKAFIVYEKDDFHYQIVDGKTDFTYSPSLEEDRGEPKCGVCITEWVDGKDPRIDVMPYYKIDKIAKAQLTKTKNTGPWKTHRDEMDIKTVIRHTCKFLPQTPELAKAVSYDESLEIGRYEGEIPEELTNVVSTEFQEEVESLNAPSESTKPEVKEPKKKITQKQYLAMLASLAQLLAEQGFTATEIEDILVRKGFLADPSKEEEKNWHDVLDLLDSYVEKNDAKVQ